jgi:hypothetical protein
MNPTAPHPLPLFKKKIINQVNKCCIEWQIFICIERKLVYNLIY